MLPAAQIHVPSGAAAAPSNSGSPCESPAHDGQHGRLAGAIGPDDRSRSGLRRRCWRRAVPRPCRRRRTGRDSKSICSSWKLDARLVGSMARCEVRDRPDDGQRRQAARMHRAGHHPAAFIGARLHRTRLQRKQRCCVHATVPGDIRPDDSTSDHQMNKSLRSDRIIRIHPRSSGSDKTIVSEYHSIDQICSMFSDQIRSEPMAVIEHRHLGHAAVRRHARTGDLRELARQPTPSEQHLISACGTPDLG